MSTDTRLGSTYRTALLKHLGLMIDQGTILDVGCYDGLFLSNLKTSEKFGIDLVPTIPLPGTQIAQADACHPPFPPESFDVIYALDVIEHIEEDQAFAEALLHLLKPGGRLILTTPNLHIRIFPPFLTRWVSLKWGHHLRFGYEGDQLKRMFQKPGYEFQIIHLKGLAYRTWYLFARALQYVSPPLAERWIRRLSTWDANHLEGPSGFLLMQVVRERNEV